MANPSIQLGTNSNWAIKEDKLLAYKEYNDYFFNKEFDFSRGTSATYVAKDGLIKTAGVQPNIVNNGDFSELGSELVTNGDFDTDSNWSKGAGWTISGGKANSDGTSGNLSQTSVVTVNKFFKITITVSNYVSGTVEVSAGAAPRNQMTANGTYTFYQKATPNTSFYIISQSFVGSVDNVSVKQVDPNDYWILGTGWGLGNGVASCDGSQTSNSSLQQSNLAEVGKIYKIVFDLTVTSGQITYVNLGGWIDNTNLNSTGTYTYITTTTTATDNFGIAADSNFVGTVDNVTVQEIQTDTPRIDFTNDTKGHLLLEPQSTNLVTQSDGSNWLKTNVTYTANTTISPDGSQNAATLNFSDENGIFRFITASGDPGGRSFTGSVYLKAGTMTDVRLRILGSSGGLGITTKFITLTNEWQRFDISKTFSGTGDNARFRIQPNLQTGTVYFYGGQVEELSHSTSLIYTTGATATRNADVCNNSGSAQDFNSEEGVLYAEIAALESTFSSSKFISISDGTYNNRASILFSNGATNKIRTFLRVGGVSQVDKSGDVTDVKDFNKVAFSYKENEFKVFINGSQSGSTDTSGSVWSSGTITKLSLTEINSALGAFNGKVRNVQVFTEALTDAELQELTS